MNSLAQFGQFATEQNRLNKIEEVKNATAAMILQLQREGGGPGKEYLGMKRYASSVAGSQALKDYFTKVYTSTPESKKAFKPEMVDEIVDHLRTSQPTGEESDYFIKNVFAKILPPQVLEQLMSGAAPAEAVTVPTTQEPTGAPPTQTSGYPQNLNMWDFGLKGGLGKEAQSAQEGILTYAGEAGYYKPLLEKYGIKPDDQGVPGEPRNMYFSSKIAQQLLEKLDAEDAAVAASGVGTPGASSDVDKAFWEYMQNDANIGPWKGMSYEEALRTGRVEKLKVANPGKYKAFSDKKVQAPATGQSFVPFTGSLLKAGQQKAVSSAAPAAAGSEPAVDPGKVERDELRQKINQDLAYHTDAFKKIDEERTRYTSSQKQFSGFSSEEQATAATHGNMQRDQSQWVTDKGTVGYPSGTVPAGSAEKAVKPEGTVTPSTAGTTPPAEPGAAVKTLTSLIENASNYDGLSDQEKKKAQSFAYKILPAVTQEAYFDLITKDPEGAFAFVKAQRQSEDWMFRTGLAMDPVNELAYQRLVRSGELKSQLAYQDKQLTLLDKQIDMAGKELAIKEGELGLLPDQLATRRMEAKAQMETAKAAIEEARAKMADIKNGNDLGTLQGDLIRAQILQMGIENEARAADTKYAGVKNAYDIYETTYKELNDFGMKWAGKALTKEYADQYNILASHFNAAVSALNAESMKYYKLIEQPEGYSPRDLVPTNLKYIPFGLFKQAFTGKPGELGYEGGKPSTGSTTGPVNDPLKDAEDDYMKDRGGS